MKQEKTLPEVHTEDVWEDCDKRHPGRQLTVVIVGETHITCRTPTNKVSVIRRARFVPTSTGYKLVRRAGKVVG